jgi:hypothetical protein
MKKLAISAAAFLASASAASLPAFACAGLACPTPVAVPEISALEGTAALAALAAIVLFAWERRRRAL